MKNQFKKLLLLFTVLICGTSFLNAQSSVLKGIVTSSQGEPLIGVSVVLKNGDSVTTVGTVTDIDGNFSINVPLKSNLSFSYIGYKAKNIIVNNYNYLKVVLAEDAEALDEVVVIGYGTVKKSDLTGAVSSIKASELSNTPAAGIEVALQGKVPGVFISKKSGKPGETADIKIRGVGSFNGSGPLWIIDGVAQNPGTEFNMNDAESVEILRDASAAAIYGASAANGVVIVTTKRGKSGEAKISFNAYLGFNNPTNLPNMLNSQQLKRLKIEDWNGQGGMTEDAMRNYSLYPLMVNQRETTKNAYAYGLDYAPTNTDYNWKDIIFSQGLTQNYDLSFTKGTGNYNYYASFNYYDEKGTYVDTNFKRYSFRLNSDVKVTKWLSFGESLQLTYTEDNPNSNADYLNNYMRTLPFMMPYDTSNQPGGYGYFPKTNADGSPVTDPITGKPTTIKEMLEGYDGSNLLADEFTTHIKNDKFNLNGNVFVKIQPIKNFSVTATLAGGVGMGSVHIEREKFQYHPQKKQMTASVTQNLDRGYGFTGQLVANYNKVFNKKHSLAIMLGAEAQKSYGTRLNGYAANMLGGIYQISLADPENRIIQDGYSNNASLSYFGRLNYSYKDKYLFMALVRRDGYDRFGPKNRWGTFPSFSAAWRISDEKFITDRNWNWLSNLKLRASWGVLGNSGIPQFLYTSNYVTPYAYYAFGQNQTSVTGLRLDYLANENIRWEEISTTNIGLDVALLKNSLTFSFDWYVKNTTDALFKSTLPSMVGMGKGNGVADTPPYTMNVGEIRNMGCDFEIAYRNNIGRDFNYTVSGNLGFVKNEVLGTNENNDILISGSVLRGGANVSYTQKGLPIGTFFAYDAVGVFQTQEEVDAYNKKAKEHGWNAFQETGTGPGDLIFKDTNEDGHIDSKDITDVGSPWPDFTYGINLSCNYKFLDFSVFLQGVQGNEIFNDFRTKTHTFLADYNTTTYALNRWTAPGSTNKNFRMNSTDPNQNEGKASSWYVENGSYLRMKNIQLGVSLPKKWLDKTFISKCRFYVSGQNLLTFTKYEGFDPEFATNSNTAYGIDTGIYPQSKSVLCGVQIDF